MCRNCYAKAAGYKWQKNYQKQHRAEVTAYANEWARANPASVAKARRRYSESNSERVRDSNRMHVKTWRKKNRPPFCLVCGEDRATEWAHIIPHNAGGPVAAWNLIPLCPTHHRCFDRGILTREEMDILKPFASGAEMQMHELQKSGARGRVIVSSPPSR